MITPSTILGFEHTPTGAFVSTEEAWAQYGKQAFAHQVKTLRPLYNLDEVQAAKAKAEGLLDQAARQPLAA